MPNFTDQLLRRSTTWMRATLSGGFYGILHAVIPNEAAEAWTLASRMHLLDDPESPDDALPVIGRDRRLDQYDGETNPHYRDRLWNAWAIYKPGGAERSTVDQLDAAGFGPALKAGLWGAPGILWGATGYMWGDRGCAIEHRSYERGPRGEPAPYWSQYWVTFAHGMTPVTGPPRPWGSFIWGEIGDGIWRLTGYTTEFHRTITGIVRKWKPPRWVFRGFRFRTGVAIWGQAGILWGQPGVQWGDCLDVDLPL